MIRLRWAALAMALGMFLLVAGCGGSTGQSFNDTPIIIGFFPATTTAGGPAFTLNIAGTGFIATSVAYWNNSPRPTTFNATSTQLSVSITAQDIATAGAAEVTVVSPAPGGGASTAVTFTITPPNNPVPAISSLAPSSTPMGAPPPGGILTVNGSSFLASSTVALNGITRTTTFVNSTQLTVSVMNSDVASNATIEVTVLNPAPGGGVSNSVPFKVGTGSAVRFKASRGSTSQSPIVVSVNSLGGSANGQSAAPAISADGRFIAFYSTATDLVAEGASGNIFVRDTCLGAINCMPETLAVDLAPDGNAPNGLADAHVALSADGRFVAFASTATNLLSNPPAAPSPQGNVYVRDLCLGSDAPAGCNPRTQLVSVGMNLGPANDSSSSPSLSADGRFVAFASTATNLVSSAANGQSEVYVRDTCSGPAAPRACVPGTLAISVDGQGGALAQSSGEPAISADGRYVAFAVEPVGSGDASAASQVLLRDTCQGADAPSDCSPSTVAIPLAPGISAAGGTSSFPSVSADGRFVVFEFQTAGESPRVFLRDTCLGSTASAGCAPSTVVLWANAAAPSISSSGRYVSFIADSSGASANVPGSRSLSVYDTCFGATEACAAQTSAIPASSADSGAVLLPADASTPAPLSSDGSFAAFFTSAALPNLPLSGHGDVLLTATPF
ncbi:MAG: hypothetical protein ACRD4Q_00430 [Candidatus Acidiferrales bacterium]